MATVSDIGIVNNDVIIIEEFDSTGIVAQNSKTKVGKVKKTFAGCLLVSVDDIVLYKIANALDFLQSSNVFSVVPIKDVLLIYTP